MFRCGAAAGRCSPASAWSWPRARPARSPDPTARARPACCARWRAWSRWRPAASASASWIPEARAGGLHFAGHLDGLKPARTAGEELRFWSRWSGADAAAAARAAERLGLDPLLELEVRRLSAGQRRRLALARLLAAPRPLWLLDEPLSPLDAGWRARFGGLMAEHLAGGGLILAAVHDPLPVAAQTLELA